MQADEFGKMSVFKVKRKSRKVRNTARSTKMADGIYPKLYIFYTPVQKEWNLPGFHVNTACNLPLAWSFF